MSYGQLFNSFILRCARSLTVSVSFMCGITSILINKWYVIYVYSNLRIDLYVRWHSHNIFVLNPKRTRLYKTSNYSSLGKSRDFFSNYFKLLNLTVFGKMPYWQYFGFLCVFLFHYGQEKKFNNSLPISEHKLILHVGTHLVDIMRQKWKHTAPRSHTCTTRHIHN